MAKMKDHTGFRNGDLFCFNCGNSYKMNLPQPIDMVSAMMKQFVKSHAKCLKTWVEPTVDQTKSTHEKAMFWLQHGSTGLSSKTMWFCLMGEKVFVINHPYDPDDFSRCYKLLKAVPEWKDELHKLKDLSKVWNNLVDNWDKLTEMYEKNTEENWKNSKQIGMFEFMQTLIRD